MQNSMDAPRSRNIQIWVEKVGNDTLFTWGNDGAPMSRETENFSMYSDMSIRTSESSSPKSTSETARASSVFPTPVGPRKIKEPIGRLGSFRPVRDRRMEDGGAPMLPGGG